MTAPTSPWNIPLFAPGDTIPSLEGVLNSISTGLNTALNTLSKSAFTRSTTYALLPTSGNLVKQHATVYADSNPQNNGDYTWNGTSWIPNRMRCALIKTISQSSTAGAQTMVTWSASAAPVDIGGFYSTSNTTRLTAPATGVYVINVIVSAQDSTSSRKIGVFKNGTFSQYIGDSQNASAYAQNPNGFTVLSLTAGDYIEISVVDSVTLTVNTNNTAIFMELVS